MSELANRFEHKLNRYAQAPEVSQAGTTQLFFDDEGKQKAFAAAIQDPNGSVYKVLLAAFNKSGGNATASFDLKMNADPSKGAQWILVVQPPALKATVATALDAVYQKIVGTSMEAKRKLADAKAKTGAGSGLADVGMLELAP